MVSDWPDRARNTAPLGSLAVSSRGLRSEKAITAVCSATRRSAAWRTSGVGSIPCIDNLSAGVSTPCSLAKDRHYRRLKTVRGQPNDAPVAGLQTEIIPPSRWWARRDEAEYLAQVLRAMVTNSRRGRWTELTERIACNRSAGRIGNPMNDRFARHHVTPSVDLNLVMPIAYPEVRHVAVADRATQMSCGWLLQRPEPGLQHRVRLDVGWWRRKRTICHEQRRADDRYGRS